MSNLAIVIPFYKGVFFRETLESFSCQTYKDFTLYIGDDASPCDISNLLNEYQEKIDIKYYRFEENMGGHDLVAHWRRCINLTAGEPWIWLFSDDDVVDPICVETFYKEKEKNPRQGFFHFDVRIINENGNQIVPVKHYPSVINSADLFYMRKLGRIHSFVVENIFSRELYLRKGGFEEYPMAWGADLVTWCKFAEVGGLQTLPDAYVNWRASSNNITPNNSEGVLAIKLEADRKTFCWYKDNIADGKHTFRLSKMIFYHMTHYCLSLTRKGYLEEIKNYYSNNLVSIEFLIFMIISRPLLRMGMQIKHFVVKSKI